ncbi:MAG: toll/interleukin-1 receptor domain-containing protein [Bacteroidetes bacterium]|nr:toll/interleukin-1 receptor domain-containing protein [Bacteroidota bacterium]
MIFISHSTPQDNYFAAWLASKLKMLGYDVWLDLNDISAGDSFNTVIKPVIQKADVFLPLTTISYAEKANNQNSGVSRELNCAATIDTNKLGHNFFIPLKVDEVNYNDFPYHYTGWNAIDFSNNWQAGLIDVVAQFDKFKINKSGVTNPISLWYEASKITNKVIDRSEQYYTNWVEISLPQKIYIHEPQLFIKEELYQCPYPYILEANRVITFADKKSIEASTLVSNTWEYAIEDFYSLDDIVVTPHFTLHEPKKKLIKLLNRGMQVHMSNCGLVCWKKNSNEKVFYFKHTEDSKRVSLKRYNKSRTTRGLTGVVTDEIEGQIININWAFSMFASADIYPVPHYKMFYSIVTSDDNLKRFETDLQLKFRRSVPSGWYNRKWFETLLAALLKLSPTIDSTEMKMQIGIDNFMLVDNMPLNGSCLKGYVEP